MAPSRAVAIIGLSAVVIFLLGLAAVGAVRPAGAPVPPVRHEVAHLVNARRLALLQAEAAATARAALPAPVSEPAPTASAAPSPGLPASATASPAPPAVSGPLPARKSPRRYKRFE
jgi:hypothetical protein